MAKHKRRGPHRRPAPSHGRWRILGIVATVVLGVGAVLVLNLGGPGRPEADPAPESHGHPPGPHGGAVVAIDRDNRFHAEAVFEPGGRLLLYTFGRELSEPRPILARTVCAAVRGHDGTDEFAVMLRPEPQEADPPGTASRFRGRLPPSMWRGHLRLVVWSLPVEGERFRFEIDSAHPPPDAATVERAEAVEAALYSTPGGKYGEEDIRANGPTAASRKYRGERPTHDDRPTPGERVCPVSRSRADPRFVWFIDRKEYQFCCPPCIDEFVRLAKAKPDQIKHPSEYVK